MRELYTISFEIFIFEFLECINTKFPFLFHRCMTNQNYNRILVFLIFGLVLTPIILDIRNVFAETKTHDAFISTGSQQLGPASIEIKYDVSFDLARPSSVQPNDFVTIDMIPKTGKLSVTLDVAGSSYTIDKDLNLGSSVDIDVAPGIELFVSTSASSFANIEGPVDKNTQTLSWLGTSPQNIQFTVSNSATPGDSIKLTVPVSIDVNAGLRLDLLILKQDLGQVQIGSFQAQPVIEETIPIGTTFGIDIGILGIIAVIAAAAGGGVFAYLFRKKSISRKQTSTNICQNCKAILPQNAKFCAKCGRKL